MRTLIAIPVYNEAAHVEKVLSRVAEQGHDVLVIDDGSQDETPLLLARQPVEVIRHAANRGYGRSLRTAFLWADTLGYDWVVTMDCDEQHEPAAIPRFVEAAALDQHDIISGSRYLDRGEGDDDPPLDRRQINEEITREINTRLGFSLTDAFCGFKGHRVEAMRRLRLDENGYAFPLQLWVQAAAEGLRICEIPVRLIYNDPNRTFGGPLDDAQTRLRHYRQALHCELERCADRLPPSALEAVAAGCRG